MLRLARLPGLSRSRGRRFRDVVRTASSCFDVAEVLQVNPEATADRHTDLIAELEVGTKASLVDDE